MHLLLNLVISPAPGGNIAVAVTGEAWSVLGSRYAAAVAAIPLTNARRPSDIDVSGSG